MLILTRNQNESIIINGIAAPRSTRRRVSAGSLVRKKRGPLDGEHRITKINPARWRDQIVIAVGEHRSILADVIAQHPQLNIVR